MFERLQISGCGARRARLAEIAGSSFSELGLDNHSNDPGGSWARSMGSLMIGWLGPLFVSRHSSAIELHDFLVSQCHCSREQVG
jgi:hypothetical protein